MKSIRFRREYTKIKGVSGCTLLDVFDVNIEDLSLDFIKYDTDSDMFENLPKQGKFLMLLFHKNGVRNDTFTTLRKSNFDNKLYYKLGIGQEFKVIIENKNRKK